MPSPPETRQSNMEHEYIVQSGTKEERYSNLLPQLAAIIEGEHDTIANMANISACLHETFRFWWTGFYRVIGSELVLGPFQGPMACTRIHYGRGVCGTAWKRGETIIVPDVNLFPGHIACSSASRSEIVIPLRHEDEIWGVLDIDSERLNNFDHVDRVWLERIAALLCGSGCGIQ